MRKNTKCVSVGGVKIGADAPITIQSMTNTDTRDVTATVAQILRLEAAGCEIVRSSVYDMACAEAFAEIKKQIHIPLVADIHFDFRLAIAAMEYGADKIRFNPGNIGSEKNVCELAACARAMQVPIRVGVNGGSLEKDILAKYHGPTPEGMVESALRHVAILERVGYDDIVISVKSSSVTDMVAAYQLLSTRVDYPLHIGVTESGMDDAGLVKSAVGIGSLLLDGIGDTLRVSLTGDPVQEVHAAKLILQAAGIRKQGLDIVSCPTCGRCCVDTSAVIKRLKAELPACSAYKKIAVMGCAVNGPGEAREADIGIAFGHTNAVVFRHGKQVYSEKLPQAIDLFIEDVKKMVSEA